MPESRNVIYKRGHTIDPKGFFIVEISTVDTSLFITAYSAVGPESFVLHFKNDEAREAMHRFGSDFNIMAMCLMFRNDRLVLRNPKNLFGGSSRLNSQQTPFRYAGDDSVETANIQIDSGVKKP